MSVTKPHTTENSASRMNFVRSSRNMTWITIPNIFLVRVDVFDTGVPPSGALCSLVWAPTAPALGYDLPSLTGLMPSEQMKTPRTDWLEAFSVILGDACTERRVAAQS